MAEAPRSSFIPKQSSSAVPTSVRRRKRFHVFGFLTSVLLFGSLALAAGTYFYRDYSEKQLDEQKSLLATESNRFSDSDIAEVHEFDRKLSAARLLLDNHTQPSKIFDALERSTMERIQYTNFSYSQEQQYVTVTLNGGTKEFSTVALQELEFDRNSILDAVVFSTLSTSQEILGGSESGSEKPSDAGQRIGLGITGSIEKSKIIFDGTDTRSGNVRPTSETPTRDQSEEGEAGAGDDLSESDGSQENSNAVNNGS